MEMLNQCPPLITFFGDRKPQSKWVSMRVKDELFRWSRASEKEPHFSAALYDLGSDPELRRDLYDAGDDRHQAELKRVTDFKARLVQQYGEVGKQRGEDIAEEEKRRRLRSLGYIE